MWIVADLEGDKMAKKPSNDQLIAKSSLINLNVVTGEIDFP